MADFSHYGGPSGEWLAVEKTLPAPVANQTLTELVEITNKTREAVSAQEMVDQGTYVRNAMQCDAMASEWSE